MEVFYYIRKIFKPTLSIMLLSYCLINSLTAAAEEYRLNVLAKLPTLSSANNIAVIPLPIKSNNEHQYLLADETGELSLLNGTNLLPLSRLPLSDRKDIALVKLTALTLHPSFSLVDKTGYQTFFTAHIEPAKTNNNIARLTLLKSPTTLPFDAVITQWKYDSASSTRIDVKQRREVIRIAVPTATHQINKIAFNPYNKIWHDDYGLMHIALSELKSESSTANNGLLYSGVVLRITPEKFGLRNYMVPSSNPFMKTNDINNEIFILGAKNIRSFSWSKQHYDALLVQHIYEGEHQVAVAKKGADWRKTYQNKLVFPLKSDNESTAEMSPYYGRKLKKLVGSVLYLSNNTKNWQLANLNTAIKNSDSKQELSGQTLGSFNSKQLSPKNKVSLLFDHIGEPLLLDITDKKLLSISANQETTGNDDAPQTEKKQDEQSNAVNSNAYGKLLLTLFVLVLAVVFYWLRPKRNSAKVKLRSQFARFELDDKKSTLSFYKRHQSEVDSQIDIANIVKSEVFLNDNKVSIINEDADHGYSEEQENQLRLNFAQVHRHKLIDKEIRQVNLYLTDKSAKTYVICLYLRKGNQRLTKAKYFDTLETIIDWSWFIASQLNPEATATRPIKAPVDKRPIKKVQNNKPKTKPVINQEIEVLKANKQTTEELHNISIHDSELINSLDKLADLKQKGFLTDEEFSLAKAKILSDMTNNK
jgi:hypothetical protein